MIISVYLFLDLDNKLLLMKRCNTGYMDGQYGLPAGHVEDGEPITTAMKRENKEEIGLDIPSSELKLVHIMHRKEQDIRLDFFFVINKWKGTPKNMEPDKCDDIRWFEINNFPSTTIGYIRDAFTSYKKDKLFSEVGW